MSQMTATSPTPQQQNRWKGRRCLAAAFIPPPAACSPKTSVALCLYTCFTLSWKTATKQTASSLPPSAASLTSWVRKDRKEKKIPPQRREPSLLQQLRAQSRRRRAGKLHRPSSWSHIAGRRANELSAFMCVA